MPVIVDNTVPTPALCRPVEHGCDIVLHSMTKYMGGHGNSIAGILVDGGIFDWAKHNERFYMFSTPEPSYHGVVFTDAMGPAAYIARARVVALRNTGSALSPFNAFLVIQGLQTLSLRMERHVDNAMAVAKHLEGHDQVEWVTYPGLESSPYYELAQKYTGGKPAALLTFGIKGGFDAGVKFYDALKIFKRLGQYRRYQVAGGASGIDHAPPIDNRKSNWHRVSRRTRSASALASSISMTSLRISIRRWRRRARLI